MAYYPGPVNPFGNSWGSLGSFSIPFWNPWGSLELFSIIHFLWPYHVPSQAIAAAVAEQPTADLLSEYGGRGDDTWNMDSTSHLEKPRLTVDLRPVCSTCVPLVSVFRSQIDVCCVFKIYD